MLLFSHNFRTKGYKVFTTLINVNNNNIPTTNISWRQENGTN